MSFLDRFKIQPKHKSADPEIRIAGVAELGASEEDAAALVALAREDSEARVTARGGGADRGCGGAGGDRRERSGSGHPRGGGRRGSRSVAAGDAAERRGAGARRAHRPEADCHGGEDVAARQRARRRRRAPDRRQVAELGRAARRRSADGGAGERSHRGSLPSSSTSRSKTDHKDAGISALERAVILVATDRATLERLGRSREEQGGREARPRDGAGDGRCRGGEEGGARSAPAADRRARCRAWKHWQPRRSRRAANSNCVTPRAEWADHRR